MRFSVLTLVGVSSVVALASTSLFVAGGFAYYLPLSVIFMLALITWNLAPFRKPRNSDNGFIWWPFIASFCVFLSACVLYSSIFTFAMKTFQFHQNVARAKNQVMSIPNPDEFGDATLKLHEKMLTESDGQPCSTDPKSKDVPDSISQLNPTQIVATKNYIVITLSPNGSSIIGYPGTDEYPVPAEYEFRTRISNGVFYEETNE